MFSHEQYTFFRDVNLVGNALDNGLTSSHLPLNLFETTGIFPEDYEQKKIMASKGMAQR